MTEGSEESLDETTSKGFQPPLKVEYIAAAIAAYMVGKYLTLKIVAVKAPMAIFYTTIGIIESLFEGY